jgi:Mn-dependent DtxR family transcriptional regulator
VGEIIMVKSFEERHIKTLSRLVRVGLVKRIDDDWYELTPLGESYHDMYSLRARSEMLKRLYEEQGIPWD